MEIGADALQALTQAEQVFGTARGRIINHPGAHLQSDVGPYVGMFDEPRKQLETIVEDARAAIMRHAGCQL